MENLARSNRSFRQMEGNNLLSPAILGAQPLVFEFTLLHDEGTLNMLNRNCPKSESKQPTSSQRENLKPLRQTFKSIQSANTTQSQRMPYLISIQSRKKLPTDRIKEYKHQI